MGKGLPLLLMGLAACGASEVEPDGGPVGMPLDCGGDDGRCLYVVADLRPPRPDEEGRVIGLDLDGRVSDETDAMGCGHPDFVAPDGTAGIDNVFVEMVPTLEDAAGVSMEESFLEVIVRGEWLFLVEASGVDSTVEPSVLVEAGPAELPEGTDFPLLSPDGDLAAGQSFVWVGPVAANEGSVDGGVLDAPLGDVELSGRLDETSDITLLVRDARLRVSLAGGEPHRGVLAGRLRIEDLLATVPDLDPDEPSLIRRTFEGQADLEPDATGVCQAISIAVQVELVAADEAF